MNTRVPTVSTPQSPDASDGEALLFSCELCVKAGVIARAAGGRNGRRPGDRDVCLGRGARGRGGPARGGADAVATYLCLCSRAVRVCDVS